jgi:hypothetical protein
MPRKRSRSSSPTRPPIAWRLGAALSFRRPDSLRCSLEEKSCSSPRPQSAAALGYPPIQNHPFADGNKRVGLDLTRVGGHSFTFEPTDNQPCQEHVHHPPRNSETRSSNLLETDERRRNCSTLLPGLTSQWRCSRLMLGGKPDGIGGPSGLPGVMTAASAPPSNQDWTCDHQT